MTSRRSRRLAGAVIGVGLAAALVAGCASGQSGSTQSSDGGAKQPAAGGAAPGAADANPQQQGGDTQAKAPTKLVPADRSLIYTGSVTVRVSDVDKAADAAGALAVGAGGYVGGDQRTSDDRRSQAQVVLRVPAARFASVVDALGRLGAQETRSISTQDVTDQIVDVDARIATAQASVDRVRSLLARAQNIGEIVSLESEMSKREADLESLKARKRKLADLTELSTMTAMLLGPDANAEKTGPQTGFVVGLRGGLQAFGTSMQLLLMVFGAVLPWLVALGIPVLIVILVLRRLSRRRHRVDVAPPETAPAPATEQ